ncbi:MAG: radical SAM family heme chaperone HemW [Alphaproteobacteria bacterium]
MSAESVVRKPLGLYVHWPYCISKCPYCDFNSHVAQTIDHDQWRTAYRRELQHWAESCTDHQVISVFFGGGTPSLMDPSTVEQVIEDIQGLFTCAEDVEITLEANPNSVEVEKFQSFRAAGVNRVSLGIQSLYPEALKFLGRAHDRGEAIKAIETAAQTFDRYSFDLIYARPDQTPQQWGQELREALPLVRDHMSLYQLTIEPGTAFHTQYQRGDFQIPDQDSGAGLYETTQEVMEAAGMPAYEVSNHARPGQECQHNLVYWRYQDYLGIGPGAHGRLLGRAQKNYRAPQTWLDNVATRGHGLQEALELSGVEAFEEAVMMGLRLTEGVAGDTAKRVQLLPTFKSLVAGGFLHYEGDGVSATNKGRQCLNAVLSELLGSSA